MVIIFMQNHFWGVLTVYKAKKTDVPYTVVRHKYSAVAHSLFLSNLKF